MNPVHAGTRASMTEVNPVHALSSTGAFDESVKNDRGTRGGESGTRGTNVFSTEVHAKYSIHLATPKEGP